MKDNSKNIVERAVNKAANALGALADIFETHGEQITDEHAQRIYAHLAHTFNTAQAQAMAMLAMSRKSGRIKPFTLDAPAVQPAAPVAAPVVQSIAPVVAPVAPLVPGEQPQAVAPAPAAPEPEKKPWRRPTGRLAGSKEPVYEEENKADLEKGAKDLSVVTDKTGGIVAREGVTGFLGDT